MNSEQKWALLSELCSAEGLKLFDIEGNSGPVLRVYITLSDNGPVQHSHCSAVSNRILNHDLVEQILPGSTILEVSSPGVNRKLTRPEHFPAAVGERVKVSFKDEQGKKTSVVGQLSTVTEKELVIESEMKTKEKSKSETPTNAAIINIARSQVVEAKVDFKF